MTQDDDVTPVTAQPVLECDCGYRCQGGTLEDRIRDGQRHAREVHGIDVPAAQVASEGLR